MSLMPRISHCEEGLASWYNRPGKKTASGQIFVSEKLTAAHRTFKFGTRLKVINLKTGDSVEVVVNDRGPVSKKRIIDLSKGAALKLKMIKRGVAYVKIQKLEG